MTPMTRGTSTVTFVASPHAFHVTTEILTCKRGSRQPTYGRVVCGFLCQMAVKKRPEMSRPALRWDSLRTSEMAKEASHSKPD
jgi:hypothetical protein